MTALSAIAAAGGAQFTLSATLLREQGNGGKLGPPLDLSKIKSGTEPDVPLQGGDVVVVERSVVGAVPYSLYFLISHIGFGIGFPVLLVSVALRSKSQLTNTVTAKNRSVYTALIIFTYRPFSDSKTMQELSPYFINRTIPRLTPTFPPRLRYLLKTNHL